MKPKQKTLLFDIETMANLAWVWAKYEQDVIAYEQQWKLLSVGYKWLGQKTIVLGTDTMTEKELVKRIHTLLDEADIVIAHNGKKFDVRKVNAKFIEFGLTPPSPYKVIDTKEVAKRYFAFNSNKLDDLGEILQVGRKVKHEGFDLWLGCWNNDKAAWTKMKRYNKQDVDLLERIYLKLRPWMVNHPILAQGTVCPNCASERLQKRGTAITKKWRHQRLQCTDCGAWTQIRLK